MYGCRGSRNTSVAGPSSTMRPAYITASRSLTSVRTERSCVMNNIESPSSSCSCFRRRRTCACTITSSAVVGSSAITRSGWHASAIAIITRCFCPPENSCGKSRERRPGRPTCSSNSPARSSASRRVAGPCARIGSAIWSPTRITGSSACCAPWKMIDPCVHRIAPSWFGSIASTSWPFNVTRPCMRVPRGSRRIRPSPIVDFPHPDSPARPSTWPRSIVRSTPRTAGTGPDCVWYSIVRSRTSSRLIADATSGSRSPRSRCRTW